MALCAVALSASSLTADMLRHVPATVATAIWKEVKSFGRSSFRVWKVFAAGCPSALPRLDLHRWVYQGVPHLALDAYTVPATPTAGEWLTILVISMPTLTCAEAVGLAHFPNLVVLSINDNRPADSDPDTDAVQDSVVRAWNTSVTADGAFARLRSLRLGGWAGISQRSLQYLSAFPVLGFFNADRTSIRGGEGLVVPSGWDAHLYLDTRSLSSEEQFLYSFSPEYQKVAPPDDSPPVLTLELGAGGRKGPDDIYSNVYFLRTALPASEPPPSPPRDGPERDPDGGRPRTQPAPSKMRSLAEGMDQCVDHGG
ncbi:MAG: hypothetical protein M1826_006395 [Phylliscum demangeonii]|nr:MAG: hypothetical protein M1826_006395 [Phylliscum demangeonii]